jgi:CDP-glucose 4,6-dehydratase
MHYLITGHTGFKGSWLSLMLEMQGHAVSGISLDPKDKSLFNQASLSSIFEHDVRLDIRSGSEVSKAIKEINPQVIIHLAAQSLVRESYRHPSKTFETNVMGTLNVLEATKGLDSLEATLIITTDKVYKNSNLLGGYVETDELGGDDPYSASKAAADIATQSWIKSFATSPVAIARAGNVIGGGDWGTDRIIPDLVNSYANGEVPKIRYPGAIRPWQHVLDCLNGYLVLVNAQLNNGIGGSWNFGPLAPAKHTVGELVNAFGSIWGVEGALWEQDSNQKPAESSFLLLDSKKAHDLLGWQEKLDFNTTISWCVDWYRHCKIVDKDDYTKAFTQDQIAQFFSLR